MSEKLKSPSPALEVNAFFGGVARGPCLHVTTAARGAELTVDEAAELVDELLRWLCEQNVAAAKIERGD